MEIDFTKYTAREILAALVEGLRNPEYKVDMLTYGQQENDICIACAATNAVTKLTNVIYSIDNIARYRHLEFNTLARGQIFNFEMALNNLRAGDLAKYNRYKFAEIVNPRNIDLPYLSNDYTEEQLLVYESLINDQIT